MEARTRAALVPPPRPVTGPRRCSTSGPRPCRLRPTGTRTAPNASAGTVHANFAQRVWKRKKGISRTDKTLSRLKAEQMVFSQSTGEIEKPAGEKKHGTWTELVYDNQDTTKNT